MAAYTSETKTTNTVLVNIKHDIIKEEINKIMNSNHNKDEEKELSELFEKTTNYVESNGTDKIWENAKITIYDSSDNVYIFRSGDGKYKFIVNRGEEGVEILRLENNKIGNAYTAYTPVEEAHEIFQNILKEDKHLFEDHIQKKLRTLKSSIYGKLKNEVNVRISIQIGGKTYYYQLGSGNKKMIIKSDWSYEFVNDSRIFRTALHPREFIAISIYVVITAVLFRYSEKETFVEFSPFIICGAPLLGIPKLTEYVQKTLGGQGQRNRN